MFSFDLIRFSLSLKRFASFSPEDVRKYQGDRFLKLVKYASQASPYYKEIIKKNKIDISNCTPEDFPVLTKEEVIRNFDRIVTDPRITKEKISRFIENSNDHNDLFLNKYYVIHTSGSSGTIGYYVFSEKELAQGISWLSYVRASKFFQKGAYIAAVRGHFAGVTMAKSLTRAPFAYKEVRTFDINLPFDDIISQINEQDPDVLSGYALALKKLAEAKEKGKLSVAPLGLYSGGEPLSTEDKAYIQKMFNAKVTNIYASSENLVMGLGRDDFEGMYLVENNLIFEIGGTYVNTTNLYNYTLPLIRYRMSDHLKVVHDNIRALPFTKVADIVGRDEYVPVFENEKGEEDFISPVFLVEFFVRNLNKFQFVLKSKKTFVFRGCLSSDITKKETEETIMRIKSKLRQILDEKRMSNVAFEVEIVKDLRPDPKTGKFRLIVRE